MSNLSNLANSSNEKREQRIMRLRSAFQHKEVITVESACRYFGYSRTTVINWAKDGNIPLIDGQATVVPISKNNAPSWWLDAWQKKG